MSNWKFTDATNTVVWRELEDGRQESCLLSALPDGVVIAAADPVALAIPGSVTMRQARLALLQSGLLSAVNGAVAGIPGEAGDAARIEWEFSATVERNRPLVQSVVGALGLTDAQLDDLFRLAATL